MKNRLVRVLISIVATILLMVILVALNNQSNNRIFVMLGGSMPEGLIQGFTYFLFFFGMCEVLALKSKLNHEKDAFSLRLLPEKDNWVVSVDDMSQLKQNMIKVSETSSFFLVDLIKKCCIKYRLNKSSEEVLSLVDAQIRVYQGEIESEQSFIRYVVWAIPSVGFIGTVIGIAASLGLANEAGTPEGIEKMTQMLSVAFDTTLVALFLSLILMFYVHYIQKIQEELLAKLNSYIIENLINRFYK